mgnify:CR=1 FL=1
MSQPTTTLRCLIMGDQMLPRQCAEILMTRGHQVVGVVSGDQGFRDWAAQQGIPQTGVDSGLLSFAQAHPYDCLFSIVNGRIIPDELLELATVCAINFHDGPLPRLAGFNVTNWAILEAETRHGITWHQMHSRLDSGGIYKQVLFELSPKETAFTLNAKCYEAALQSFPELVEELAAGRTNLRAQDLSERSYIPRYRRPSGFCSLDWTLPAKTLDALFRALDLGPYPNPFALPKFWDGQEFQYFGALEVLPDPAGEPGEFEALPDGGLRVGTATSGVLIREPRRLSGEPFRPPRSSGRFPALDAELRDRLTQMHSSAAKHEHFWVSALGVGNPLSLINPTVHTAPDQIRELSLSLAQEGEFDIPAVVSAFLGFCARTSDSFRFTVGFMDHRTEETLAGLPPVATAVQPLVVDAQADQRVTEFQARISDQLTEMADRGPLLLDLVERYPDLRKRKVTLSSEAYHVGLMVTADASGRAIAPLAGCDLTLILSQSCHDARLAFNTARLSAEEAQRWVARIEHAVKSVLARPEMTISEIPCLPPDEFLRQVEDWNHTARAYESSVCIHELIERQASLRPASQALAFEDSTVSYAELNQRANQLAHYLRSLGAGPNQLVGILCDRSVEMVVALLGVLKAGAAYVPIDPAFPAHRRTLMIEDSQARIILTQTALASELGDTSARAVLLDSPNEAFLHFPDNNPSRLAQPADLAYVIYTSGSTGRPKGVEITHRNAVNFFAGMDDFGGTEPGVWLAVTSISFDISVFELLWTLARGFKVVLANEEHRALVSRQTPRSDARKPLDFSLFYFSSDESAGGRGGKYRLLLEGARFGDENGFHAVWTPERHFHAFGGLYPNPSVASAAIAATTQNIQIRSGSVVLPLHHPVRVAEEWSVVDNLSNGRVGISFASGWHARDFLLAPQNYKRAKDVMFQGIELVRRLWKGEAVTFSDGNGQPAAVKILPKPVQAELPVWVTAAGNPETFRMAGERGFNILTHLLGQKLEDVADKIRIYREARLNAGFDPNQGQVTLMLHTYVASSIDEAREVVREPMKQYLRSSVDLIKKAPWSFPAFTNAPKLNDVPSLDLSSLTEAEMDILLDHSFDRYFETSGLFGTVENCAAMAEKVRQAGVTEIACLIDFGVGTEQALDALPLLDQVRRRVNSAGHAGDYSLPAQIEAHHVTHLQCTPSLAKMLVATPDSRQAIGRLQRMFVGGEAMPSTLAGQLNELVGGRVYNMYGPTETTVWSSVAPVSPDVSIGRPIANTVIYILDGKFRPVPTGFPGELFIGGDGVSRGYWRRPDLTAEKFLPNPFVSGRLMYRTGDLARYRSDGSIEYLGRTDHQVKIRGYRIELGEIETVLIEHPEVSDCVVHAIQQDSGPTLLGYYVTAGGDIDDSVLRSLLRNRLPDYMVPAQFIRLDRLPLTPNGKVDRKALPAPSGPLASPAVVSLADASTLENEIAAIWRRELNRQDVGLDDNFFDIGGHSILVVQVNAALRALLNRDVSLVEMFRFPTVRSLANQLGGENSVAEAAAGSASRANLRRGLLAGRMANRRFAEGSQSVVE